MITDQTSSGPPLLEIRDLVKSFGGLRVVDRMTLSVAQGEMVGLIGPNGAGKTTLFNLVAGTLRPEGGTIMLSGRAIHDDPPERRIRHGLGRTFQIPRPFPEMTVLENVLTAVQHQTGEGMLANFLTPRRVAREENASIDKARALLDFVTLDALENEPAGILSGGQRKLLELARILIADPALILLDEPAAGVNPALLDVIADRIVEINGRGVTVLLIEHNMPLVERLCGRALVMAAGQTLAEGRPADLARNREVVEVYLGEARA